MKLKKRELVVGPEGIDMSIFTEPPIQTRDEALQQLHAIRRQWSRLLGGVNRAKVVNDGIRLIDQPERTTLRVGKSVERRVESITQALADLERAMGLDTYDTQDGSRFR